MDTDACVAYLNGGDPKLRHRWLRSPSEDMALCSVVKAELTHGAWGSTDPLGTLARVNQFCASMRSLPFHDRAAQIYGEIVSTLDRRGRAIGTCDAMIAAIALADNLTVVTRNTRHFRRIPALRVVRW
ncbi:MAG: type II toxin-antitoxin system VapC family toxin [Myxococcota bacterium]